MRVISINVNGIRAAARKGFFDWLNAVNADVVCLQETKAQVHQLTDPCFMPDGYTCEYFDAQKKGYSGVAIYSRITPQNISTGLGWEVADTEGRYIQFDFDNLSIASLYMPSGSSSEERQAIKFDFLDRYLPLLKKLKDSAKPFLICGDWNIAHTKQDIKNWRGNLNNSGFLPEERAWLDTVFHEIGLVDTFRQLNREDDQYTWWSNRGQARAKNVGWRIDYQVATPDIADTAIDTSIYKDQFFSDHAPLIVDYDMDLVAT